MNYSVMQLKYTKNFILTGIVSPVKQLSDHITVLITIMPLIACPWSRDNGVCVLNDLWFSALQRNTKYSH